MKEHYLDFSVLSNTKNSKYGLQGAHRADYALQSTTELTSQIKIVI